MKEHPILFSGPMVRAILYGTKTMTRRVVKPQPSNGWGIESPPVLGRITSEHPKMGRFGVFVRRGIGTDFPECDLIPCPYGQPGDRLWVREAWLTYPKPITSNLLNEGADTWPYVNDVPLSYAADEDGQLLALGWVKKPSIHMPRWASRITLEITNVRVERLQEIDEQDAMAEGVLSSDWGKSYRFAFSMLWDSINEKRGYGWNANPWVWVVEFKRIGA